MSADTVVQIAGSLALLAWVGAWVEVFLMKTFHPGYFRFGPTLIQRTRQIQASSTIRNLSPPPDGIPRLTIKPIGRSTWLVRRRGSFMPLMPPIPPVWSARMEVVVEEHSGARLLRLTTRHGLAWPIFLAVPGLLTIWVAFVNGTLWTTLPGALWTVVAGFLVGLSVRAARRDGERVWAFVTNLLG